MLNGRRVVRDRTRSIRRRVGAIALALALVGVSSALGSTPAGAVPPEHAPTTRVVPQPRPPSDSEFTWAWDIRSCRFTDAFRLRAQGRARTLIVPSSSRLYYMRIAIQIDRWRPIESVWQGVARRTTDSSRFGEASVPYLSRRDIKVLIAAQLARSEFSARVTVHLLRVQPGTDGVVWRYTERSPTFRCPTGAPRA
jgi:hypothetical protein